MKSIVIYFSQTGSTKKVAYAIRKGMSQLIEQCNIAPLKEVAPQDLERYDLIGLGSPVWQAEPPNIRLFINSLPYSPGKHIFSFCTHGCGGKTYFPSVVKLLKERGFTAIGTRDWYGSVHIPCFPKPYLTDGHPDEVDLKEAEEFGREMVEVSQRISAGETQLIPPVPEMPPPPPPPSNPPDPNRSAHGEKKYDRDKCTYPKCHICIDNCPMDCIDLSVPEPTIPRDCKGGCVFCALICPTGAIYSDIDDLEYGLEVLHSNIWIFEQDLVEAEAAGHFRRLVPLEKVGWDTPYYKVYNKHPRYKIPEENCTDEP